MRVGDGWKGVFEGSWGCGAERNLKVTTFLVALKEHWASSDIVTLVPNRLDFSGRFLASF